MYAAATIVPVIATPAMQVRKAGSSQLGSARIADTISETTTTAALPKAQPKKIGDA